MSELGAGIALRTLAARYDDKHADKVVRWLETEHEVSRRWDPIDVRTRIARHAEQLAADLGPSASRIPEPPPGERPELEPQTVGRLQALAAELAAAPAESLIAVFHNTAAREDATFADVRFAPARALVPRKAGDAGDSLAIVITQNACGRAAALRGTERLRQALGCLYLAATLLGQTPLLLSRIADRFPPGLYLAPSGGEAYGLTPDVLAGAALTPLDVDAVLLDRRSHELMATILEPAEHDLALTRGRQGAAWLQRGFDALSFADAALAFGVALECVIGDESAGNTVDNLSRRCGLLLVEDSDPLQRYDRSKQAKRLYDWRSKVAHGRFDPAGQPAADLDAVRSEFARFVSDVTAAFAEKARSEGWRTYDDLREWYELALLT